MESVYTLAVKVLENSENLTTLPAVLRTITLYTCRFLDRRQYRKHFKTLTNNNKEDLEQFLSIKDRIDNSTYKNQLLVAFHTMAGFPRKTAARFAAVATTTKVAHCDLVQLFGTLTHQEQQTLLKKFKAPLKVHTNREVNELTRKLEPIVKNLAKHYLQYVSKYDLGQPSADIENDLRLFAVYIIRRYEILGYSEEHLLKSTVRALQHNVFNMAGKFGRPKRRHISRTHKVEGGKEVWHFNPQDLTIKKVLVEGSRSARKLSAGGVLEVPITYKHVGTAATYVPVSELYDKKPEAAAARLAWQEGKQRRKIPLISLVKDELDEYQLTHISLLQERGSEGFKLIDVLPSTLRADHTNQFLGQLSVHASARLQMFAELVLGHTTDPLFEQWLEGVKHRDISILNQEQLGRLAGKYLGLSLSKLQEDVLGTPAALWTAEQRKVMTETDPIYCETGELPSLVVSARKLQEAFTLST